MPIDTFYFATDTGALYRTYHETNGGVAWVPVYVPESVDIPAGCIQMYGGSTVPTGWLECTGSAVSRALYANLFTAIGTTWGAGDGSTTFNLPDLRGRTPIGVGTGSGLTARTLGGTGGAETHVLATSEIPSHQHGATSVQFLNQPGAGGTANVVGGTATNAQANTAAAGGGGSHANMQPWAAVKFIIKI